MVNSEVEEFLARVYNEMIAREIMSQIDVAELHDIFELCLSYDEDRTY